MEIIDHKGKQVQAWCVHNGFTKAESHHGPGPASVKECNGWWVAFCPMPLLTLWLYFCEHVTLSLRSIPHLQSWDDTVILVALKKINARMYGKHPSMSYNRVIVNSNTVPTKPVPITNHCKLRKEERMGKEERASTLYRSSCFRLAGSYMSWASQADFALCVFGVFSSDYHLIISSSGGACVWSWMLEKGRDWEEIPQRLFPT